MGNCWSNIVHVACQLDYNYLSLFGNIVGCNRFSYTMFRNLILTMKWAFYVDWCATCKTRTCSRPHQLQSAFCYEFSMHAVAENEQRDRREIWGQQPWPIEMAHGMMCRNLLVNFRPFVSGGSEATATAVAAIVILFIVHHANSWIEG